LHSEPDQTSQIHVKYIYEDFSELKHLGHDQEALKLYYEQKESIKVLNFAALLIHKLSIKNRFNAAKLLKPDEMKQVVDLYHLLMLKVLPNMHPGQVNIETIGYLIKMTDFIY